MKAKNVHSLFDRVHAVTLDEEAAQAFTKRAGTEVKAGDELWMYVDKNGLAAQAILSRESGDGAVAYNERDGFLWGKLLEGGDKTFLVGEGKPCVMVDLSDLRYWFQDFQ